MFPQNNASKLLLAIMESRHDSENAERILYNMRPKELVCGLDHVNPYSLYFDTVRDVNLFCHDFRVG